jgi:hypothetical protein
VSLTSLRTMRTICTMMNTTDAVLDSVMVFARLARPGDEVAPEMAVSKYRAPLNRVLGLRGLALEECGGEYTVAATIAWKSV